MWSTKDHKMFHKACIQSANIKISSLLQFKMAVWVL